MVEAVAVLPLVVLLFAALSYFGAVYLTRIEAHQAARAAAWSHALGACEDGRSLAGADLLDELDQQGASVPRELDAYGEAAGGQSLVTRGGRARAAVSRPVRDQAGLGLPTGTLTARFELPCDERPQGGSPARVLRYGWRQVRLW
jgi:hypothetical protein